MLTALRRAGRRRCRLVRPRRKHGAHLQPETNVAYRRIRATDAETAIDDLPNRQRGSRDSRCSLVPSTVYAANMRAGNASMYLKILCNLCNSGVACLAKMYLGARAESWPPAQGRNKHLIQRVISIATDAGTAIAGVKVSKRFFEMEDVMNALFANVMVGNGGTAVARFKAPVYRMRRAGGAVKIALAVAAPFIGLVYVVAFPIVGLAMLAWMGARALALRPGRITRFARNVALFIAAPFVGLAYAVAFPFVGVGMLAWMGARALVKR